MSLKTPLLSGKSHFDSVELGSVDFALKGEEERKKTKPPSKHTLTLLTDLKIEAARDLVLERIRNSPDIIRTRKAIGLVRHSGATPGDFSKRLGKDLTKSSAEELAVLHWCATALQNDFFLPHDKQSMKNFHRLCAISLLFPYVKKLTQDIAEASPSWLQKLKNDPVAQGLPLPKPKRRHKPHDVA
jgi:hypothetical protein